MSRQFFDRATVPIAAFKIHAVIRFGGTAHKHSRRDAGQSVREIRRLRGGSVTLDKHEVIPAMVSLQSAQSQSREASPRGGADGNRDLPAWTMTDLDSAHDATGKDREVEAVGQPLDEPDLRPALDDKAELRRGHAPPWRLSTVRESTVSAISNRLSRKITSRVNMTLPASSICRAALERLS